MKYKAIFSAFCILSCGIAGAQTTFTLYDAGVGPATDPLLGGDPSWGTFDANGGTPFNLNAGPSTTNSGAAAWEFGDNLMGGGQGDALYYEFDAATTAAMVTSPTGFTIDIEIEALGIGGYIALGDASNVLGGGINRRYGATPGMTANPPGIETLTYTWPSGGPLTSNFGTGSGANSPPWIGAANTLRLSLADNSAGNSRMHFKLVSLKATYTYTPPAIPDFTIGGDTSGGTPDVTDPANWTTNDVDYVQDATTGSEGYAGNWENITANTAVATSTGWDCSASAGSNFTWGRVFMYTAESVDLSTLPNGITRLGMSGTFVSDANTNWRPVMAITEGGVTTYYRDSSATNNPWNGTGAQGFFSGTSTISGSDFAGLVNATNIAGTNAFGMVETRDLAEIPVLRPEWVWDIPGQQWNLEGSPTGVATFGFIQWNASSGSSLNTPSFTTSVAAFEVLGYSDAADIGTAPAAYTGLAGALDSSDFDYQYELDSEPELQDLDTNTVNDWSSNVFTDYSSIPGAMSRFGGSGFMRTDASNSAPGVDTIDQATVNGDVTLEFRARFGGTPPSRGFMGFAMQQPGTDNGIQFEIEADEVHMDGNAGNMVVNTGDNTDAFHNWRIAYKKTDNQFWVWKDDTLIYGGGLEPGNGYNPHRGNILHGGGLWWIGDYSSGLAGDIEIDYIRVHGAAVPPVATTWTASSDGNWDTSTTNWDAGSGAVAYANGDEVTFPDGAGTGSVTLSGTIEPGTVEFANNTLAYDLNGVGIGGTTGLSVNGGGAVTLNNVNTYTGITEAAVGSLTVSGTGAIGDSTTVVRAGATLTVQSGGSIGAANADPVLSPVVVQPGGLLTIDSGGSVDICDATIDGTVMVNGTLGDVSGTFATVYPGGVLGGTGTVVSDIVLDGGTLAPGASVGTLTTTGLVAEWLGGSTYEWGIATWGGAAGTGYDQFVADEIDVLAAIGDEMTIAITPDPAVSGFIEDDQTYVIASATTLTGFFADSFIIDASAFQAATGATGSWAIQANGNDIELVYTMGSGSDYDAWAIGNGYWTPGDPNSGPTEDFNGDGMLNDVKYTYGLDPTDGTSINPITVPLDQAAGTFTYTRRDPALTSLTYSYEWSTTLAGGSWTTVVPTVADVVVPSGDNQTVTVDLTGAPGNPLANPEVFVRVVATP